MRGTRTLVFAGLLVMAATAAQAQQTPARGYKAVHLFNVAAQDEAQFLMGIAQLNDAVAKAGIPDVRYRVWKVQGQAKGPQEYLYESTWPDKATYDKAHANPEFKKVLERVEPLMSRLLKDYAYNRYAEVALPKP
jgi:quinol monooxygenase YgiN